MHSFNFFYIHFTLCEHFDGISDLTYSQSSRIGILIRSVSRIYISANQI